MSEQPEVRYTLLEFSKRLDALFAGINEPILDSVVTRYVERIVGREIAYLDTLFHFLMAALYRQDVDAGEVMANVEQSIKDLGDSDSLRTRMETWVEVHRQYFARNPE